MIKILEKINLIGAILKQRVINNYKIYFLTISVFLINNNGFAQKICEVNYYIINVTNNNEKRIINRVFHNDTLIIEKDSASWSIFIPGSGGKTKPDIRIDTFIHKLNKFYFFKNNKSFLFFDSIRFINRDTFTIIFEERRLVYFPQFQDSLYKPPEIALYIPKDVIKFLDFQVYVYNIIYSNYDKNIEYFSPILGFLNRNELFEKVSNLKITYCYPNFNINQ